MKRVLPIIALIFALGVPLAAAQTSLTFTFANGEITGVAPNTQFEVDVMIAAGAAGTKLGDTQTYINYSELGFGSSVVGAGAITADLGADLVANGFYSAAVLNDNTAGRVSITVEWPLPGLPAFGLDVPTTPMQLIHVTIDIANDTETAGLSFEQPLMVGNQRESDNVISYDPIVASDTDDSPLDPALAIELVDFSAAVAGGRVALNWAVASADDVANFVVESSPMSGNAFDQTRSWAPAAVVQSEAGVLEYAYTVEGLDAGTYSFRLASTEVSGEVSYSSEIELTIEVAGSFSLSEVYPNPFADRAGFTLAVKEQQEVEVSLFDILGREVTTIYDGTMRGNESYRLEVEAGSLPSGLYLIRALGENFATTRTVTLTR